MKINKKVLIKTIFIILILFSIVTTYFVAMINKDFEIFTNPEGPDTSDYFEE